MNADHEGPPPDRIAGDDADTSLPLLRTWRGVYIFVAVVFCVWVAGLVLLPFLFS